MTEVKGGTLENSKSVPPKCRCLCDWSLQFDYFFEAQLQSGCGCGCLVVTREDVFWQAKVPV